jgi:hypothetical protein
MAKIGEKSLGEHRLRRLWSRQAPGIPSGLSLFLFPGERTTPERGEKPQMGGLSFTDAGGNTQKVVVALSDIEIDLLEMYCEQVASLFECRICREGQGVTLGLSWDQERGLSGVATIPQWDDVIVLLHKLRPLILQKEPASYRRISGLVARHLKGSPAMPLLAFLKGQYTGEQMQAVIQMYSNSVLVNSEETLFTWLNAHEYHRDEDKRRLLDELHQIIPLDWTKGVFLSLLLEKVRAIDTLSLVCELLLGRRQTLDVPALPVKSGR